MPPPEEQEIAVGSASVRFFSGALLPAYLASHMLHHWPRPLLWLNDFATLWTGLSTAQRQAGIEAAQQVRWSRVLRLAIRWTDLLSDAAAAASPSLRRVEDEILSPRARIAVRQLLSTSESVRDRGVMLRELVLPASARGNAARVLSLWRQRLTGGERPK
jgi:hypothetical protein